MGRLGGDPGWDDFLAAGDAVDDRVLDARIGEVARVRSRADHLQLRYHRPAEGDAAHQPRADAAVLVPGAVSSVVTKRTRLWTALPIFWTAGFNTAMGATLAAGGCWVMQETFEPGEALRLIARERVTEPYSLPHQTAALAEHPDWADADLSSLDVRVRQVGVRAAPERDRQHVVADAGRLRAVGDQHVRLRRHYVERGP